MLAAFRLVTPSVKPSVCQLPLRGSLLVRYLNSYVKPPSLREVDFAKQKTEGVHRGCSCLSQPLSLTSFDSSPAGEPFCI